MDQYVIYAYSIDKNLDGPAKVLSKSKNSRCILIDEVTCSWPWIYKQFVNRYGEKDQVVRKLRSAILNDYEEHHPEGPAAFCTELGDGAEISLALGDDIWFKIKWVRSNVDNKILGLT